MSGGPQWRAGRLRAIATDASTRSDPSAISTMATPEVGLPAGASGAVSVGGRVKGAAVGVRDVVRRGVEAAVGEAVAVEAAVAVAVAAALALAPGDAVELALGDAVGEGVGEGVGGGVGAATLLAMFAEQVRRDPPPLAEPLHWLTVTPAVAAPNPVAVQFIPTRVPPLAEPLHWVIVAPLVVAGNGLQPVVIPPPEPTHWFTVAPKGLGLTPMKSFVIWALHRMVPPPPLIELLHWLTTVTGPVNDIVVFVHAAVGSPAAPWHSRTVTTAVPPAAVNVLMTVTSQIRPRPPVLSTPFEHVVVVPIVAAETRAVEPNEPAMSIASRKRPPRTQAGRRCIVATL